MRKTLKNAIEFAAILFFAAAPFGFTLATGEFHFLFLIIPSLAILITLGMELK